MPITYEERSDAEDDDEQSDGEEAEEEETSIAMGRRLSEQSRAAANEVARRARRTRGPTEAQARAASAAAGGAPVVVTASMVERVLRSRADGPDRRLVASRGKRKLLRDEGVAPAVAAQVQQLADSVVAGAAAGAFDGQNVPPEHDALVTDAALKVGMEAEAATLASNYEQYLSWCATFETFVQCFEFLGPCAADEAGEVRIAVDARGDALVVRQELAARDHADLVGAEGVEHVRRDVSCGCTTRAHLRVPRAIRAA